MSSLCVSGFVLLHVCSLLSFHHFPIDKKFERQIQRLSKSTVFAISHSRMIRTTIRGGILYLNSVLSSSRIHRARIGSELKYSIRCRRNVRLSENGIDVCHHISQCVISMCCFPWSDQCSMFVCGNHLAEEEDRITSSLRIKNKFTSSLISTGHRESATSSCLIGINVPPT